MTRIYRKFILTMIAVGIIGLNYHLFKGEIVSPANAASNEIHKITICNENGSICTRVLEVYGLRVYNTG
jgi:hypothetical protein